MRGIETCILVDIRYPPGLFGNNTKKCFFFLLLP